MLLLGCCVARFPRRNVPLFYDHPPDTMEQCNAILRKDPVIILQYTREHTNFSDENPSVSDAFFRFSGRGEDAYPWVGVLLLLLLLTRPHRRRINALRQTRRTDRNQNSVMREYTVV